MHGMGGPTILKGENVSGVLKPAWENKSRSSMQKIIEGQLALSMCHRFLFVHIYVR